MKCVVDQKAGSHLDTSEFGLAVRIHAPVAVGAVVGVRAHRRLVERVRHLRGFARRFGSQLLWKPETA